MLNSAFLLFGTVLIVSGQRAQFQTPRVGSVPVVPQQALEYNLTFVVSAKDLPNTGLVSDVDPYIKVYYINRTISEPIKFATTEVVDNEPNPEFTRVISYPWTRGQQQKIIFKVKNHNKFRDDTLGDATIDLDDYVANKNQKTNVSLSNGGSILVQKTTPIRFQLHARNLPRKDAFNTKSDPYVKVNWRRGSNGADIKFYQTKTQNDVENADWNETIEFPNYIKGTDQWWHLEVRDDDGIGKSDDLGEALVEVDPYAINRQTKKVRLGTSGSAELYITPM